MRYLDALPQWCLEPRRFALGLSAVALIIGIIFGAAHSFVPLGIALTVLVLVVLAVFKQEEALATAIIIVSVLLDWYELFYPEFYFPVTTTAVACLFIAFRFLLQSSQRPWVSPARLRWWGALVILAIFPTLRAVGLFVGIRYYLAVFVNAFLLALIGTLIARNLAHLRRLLSCLSVFGVLVALQSIIYARLNVFILANQNLADYLNYYQYFQVTGTDANRAGSFLLNPDFNGAFLAMMLFLPVGLFFTSASLRVKAFYAAEAIILFVALYYTYSLGSLLAVGVGSLAFVVIVARGRIRWFILGGLGAASLGGLVIFHAQAQVLITRASDPKEFLLRLGLWETAVRVIAAHPLTGIGLGLDSYLLRAEPYRVPLQARSYAQPHNSFLEIGAMAGLPVLIVFLYLLIRALMAAWRSYQQANRQQGILIAAGIIAMLTTCVNGMVINDWTLPPLAATGWLILGAISSPALARSLQKQIPPDKYAPKAEPLAGENTLVPQGGRA